MWAEVKRQYGSLRQKRNFAVTIGLFGVRFVTHGGKDCTQAAVTMATPIWPPRLENDARYLHPLYVLTKFNGERERGGFLVVLQASQIQK